MLGDLSQGRRHEVPGSSEQAPLPYGVRDACKGFLPSTGIWSILHTQQQPSTPCLGLHWAQWAPGAASPVITHRPP